MTKKLFTVLFVVVGMVGVAHAQDAEIPGINSATGANTPTPGTTAAAQAQQQQQPSSAGGTGFVALAPIPGLTSSEVTSVVNATSLSTFFNNLYKYLIGLAAILAVIMIIWGGLEISTQDSVSKNRDGKEHIYNAIFGLVLVLSPALVFSIINPAILNLSLNLPPLDTASGPPPASVTTTTPCDSSQLTQEQQRSCRDLQTVRNQGTLNSTPAQMQAAQAGIQVVIDQRDACTNSGGRVFVDQASRQGGACSALIIRHEAGNDPSRCTILPDGSVCIK